MQVRRNGGRSSRRVGESGSGRRAVLRRGPGAFRIGVTAESAFGRNPERFGSPFDRTKQMSDCSIRFPIVMGIPLTTTQTPPSWPLEKADTCRQPRLLYGMFVHEVPPLRKAVGRRINLNERCCTGLATDPAAARGGTILRRNAIPRREGHDRSRMEVGSRQDRRMKKRVYAVEHREGGK